MLEFRVMENEEARKVLHVRSQASAQHAASTKGMKRCSSGCAARRQEAERSRRMRCMGWRVGACRHACLHMARSESPERPFGTSRPSLSASRLMISPSLTCRYFLKSATPTWPEVIACVLPTIGRICSSSFDRTESVSACRGRSSMSHSWRTGPSRGEMRCAMRRFHAVGSSD
eukprot:1761175-Pleurochrysis_carterae.AAC.1